MPTSRTPGRPRRACQALAAIALACAGTAASAEVQEYAIALPEGGRVAYEVPFDVPYAGKVSIEATWDGGRILAFRLEGPPDVRVRRSGPSPQRFEAEVALGAATVPRTLTLHVVGLPATGAGSGRVRIRLPDSPEVVAARVAASRPPPPPPPEPQPWMVGVESPIDAPPDRADVYRAIESFRGRVVDETSWSLGVDACRWQEDALRYLVGQRDRLAAGGTPPSIATRRYFRQVADAVAAVERFRHSDDPFVAGTIPEEPSRRRAWLAVREQRVRPLERELDLLMTRLEDGFVPELESETWPQRFVSCLTACQRHFDALAVGGDPGAGNARLAEAQWDPIVAASEALGALAMVSASSIDEDDLRTAGVPE